MSNASAEGAVPNPDLDDMVVGHLRDHPDFFERHEGLLTALRIPHSSGHAVSLVERQLEMLREENAQLRSRMRHLAEVARDNERLSARLQQVTLALMDASNLREAVAALEARMKEGFEANGVSLRFVVPGDAGGHPHVVQDSDPALQPIRQFLAATRPKCGRFRKEPMEYLFGELAPEIRSSALIPFANEKGRGLLAIASTDGKRFHPGMGTLFLAQLGELTSHAVRSLLPD